jgi:hypothetical protein
MLDEQQATAPTPSRPDPAPVTVVDFDMRFGSMVWFMIKWAIAAIPAVIILFTVGAFCAVIVGSCFSAWPNYLKQTSSSQATHAGDDANTQNSTDGQSTTPQAVWETPKDPADRVVFVTSDGTFHRYSCPVRNGVGVQMTARQAQERSYKPCQRCKPLDSGKNEYGY